MCDETWLGPGVQEEAGNDERILFIVTSFFLYSRALGRRSIAQKPKGAVSKMLASMPAILYGMNNSSGTVRAHKINQQKDDHR